MALPVQSPTPITIPVTPVRAVPPSASAEERHAIRIEAFRDVCELLDEILFDDEGDALATIAPWLVANGINPSEVQ